VEAARAADVALETQVLDAIQQALVAQARLGPVRRGVVDDEHVLQRVRLGEQRVEAFDQERAAVEREDDRADLHAARG
jgi:hypothetical protein